MPTKQLCESAMQAVADVPDGASLLVHSFGPPQAWPTDCLLALVERGVKDLTVVCNTPSGGPTSLNVLADKQQIRKVVCSYIANPSFDTPIAQQVRAGEIEVEMVPQGTLIERVRAGGSGLAGFYTPTGVGTAVGRRQGGARVRRQAPYVFERAIAGDFALLQAYQADEVGQSDLSARHAELRSRLRHGRQHHHRGGEGGGAGGRARPGGGRHRRASSSTASSAPRRTSTWGCCGTFSGRSGARRIRADDRCATVDRRASPPT